MFCFVYLFNKQLFQMLTGTILFGVVTTSGFVPGWAIAIAGVVVGAVVGGLIVGIYVKWRKTKSTEERFNRLKTLVSQLFVELNKCPCRKENLLSNELKECLSGQMGSLEENENKDRRFNWLSWVY